MHACVKYYYPKSDRLIKEAKNLVEKEEIYLSSQEEQFVKKMLATPVISSPKLVIKYHKTKN